MKINARSNEPVTLNAENVEEVRECIYIGSKITADGDSEKDVEARISKPRGAFAILNIIWKSTKIKIFKSNVLGVLLYGAESWKTIYAIINKLDVFQTRCLRRILHIFWPQTISNSEL